MCGIFVSVRWQSPQEIDDDASFKELARELEVANAARGPDAQSSYQRLVEDNMSSSVGILVELFASELRLRGDTRVVQPHAHGVDGNVLCWNGEIFEGLDVASDENDGVKLYDALCALDSPSRVPELLGTIEGPYAFVFYHAPSRQLIFGRDPLGRRSLLVHKPSTVNPWFLLASVSAGRNPAYEYEELETEAIYCLDLSSVENAPAWWSRFDAALITWPRERHGLPYASLSAVNTSLPPEDGPPPLRSLDEIPPHLSMAVEELILRLDRSVMLRVRDIARAPGIGEGQARVAVLFSGGIDSTVLTFLAHRHVPLDKPIDLLNVAFENPRKIRVQTEGNVDALPKRQKNERKRASANNHIAPTYNVPDRKTGLEELEELRRLCPGRMWNFVEINVPYEESQAALPAISAAMWPNRTVMDLSLATALYFASRAIGMVRSNPDAQAVPYTSPARVLLSGLGSDELLGGYGRARTVFGTGGWEAVIKELQWELDQIPTRNLGRDDRIISTHAKETRHPFLSLPLVRALSSMPAHHKLDPRADVGVGDKMLLRLAARRLGLVGACGRKKRAMQFGSHAARMESGSGDGGGRRVLS